eukprot:1043859-Pyramimonas_sp.AAC.1
MMPRSLSSPHSSVWPVLPMAGKPRRCGARPVRSVPQSSQWPFTTCLRAMGTWPSYIFDCWHMRSAVG